MGDFPAVIAQRDLPDESFGEISGGLWSAMNVAVLGVGAAGEVTARLLSLSPEIEHLRIVDVRPARLHDVQKRIARDVEAVQADLGTAAGVRKACRGADVVVQSSLPDYNMPIMQQALRQGAHYIDLASEGSANPGDRSRVHLQLAMDGDFRRADRTAVLGMGAAPGLTNLLAVHGSRGMDRIDSIRIRVYGSGYADVEGYPFAPLFSPATFLEEVLWPAVIWKGDRVVKLPPFSGEEEFPFPDPLGSALCYNVNNEECETMPKILRPDIGFIDFKYALAPRRKVLLENLHRLGLTGTAPISVKGVQVAPLDVLVALMPDPSSLAPRVRGHTCVVVELTGTEDGRPLGRRLWTIMDHDDARRKMNVHATAFLTGAPPAAAVVALLEGEIAKRGVTTAGGLDASRILARIAKLGVPLFEGEIGAARGHPLVL